MTRTNGLPRRVYVRHGAFYFVTLAGRWLRLSAEKDGEPAMYRALAALVERDTAGDRMPAVVGRWLAEKAPDWAAKQLENQTRYGDAIAHAFADFRPADVTTKVCNEFLLRYRPQARTHNAYRTALRQILALAAREGLRDGANPIDNIQTRATPGRHRTVTEAEALAIRAAALERPRNGAALAQMIDLALLTGQRIGDLLKLRWQDVTADGIRFVQGKGQGRVRLTVEWSDALRTAIEACRRSGAASIAHVLQKEGGGPYRYSGIRSAWVRACARAGVDDLNIHDLRGKAGVDALGEDEDMRGAQRLLGHSSEKMTRHYVQGKYQRRVKPAR